VRIDVKRNGNYVSASLFNSEDGQPIIVPGGTAERYISVETPQATATGGYEPGTTHLLFAAPFLRT